MCPINIVLTIVSIDVGLPDLLIRVKGNEIDPFKAKVLFLVPKNLEFSNIERRKDDYRYPYAWL